jgi:FlaA1/EpsC-like NDP-sugar epimerase
MATSPAFNRIAVNVGLDAVLAALSVPLADWLAAPERMPLGPVASPAWGAVSLLVAGVPFRLPLQFWRYTGLGELVGVAASSVLGAALFSLGLHLAGVALPSPSFPVGHALCLLVLLGLPRIGYRLLRESPAQSFAPERRPVLLLGAGDGADLFLTALAADGGSQYRAVGLLSFGEAQTGRRIQNCPVLGRLQDAPDVLERLRSAGDAPDCLVITEPSLDGPDLETVLALARREGLAVATAPLPTLLGEPVPVRI